MLPYSTVTAIELLEADRAKRAEMLHRAAHPELFPSVSSRVVTRLRKAMGIAR